MTTKNREAWLTQAIKPLAKMIDATGIAKVPTDVQVSVGWPGGRSMHKTIGQCWKTTAGKGKNHIFISPLLNDPHAVLETLLHELVHAADDCENKHAGPFVKMIRAVGLEGKPTATHAGPDLAIKLAAIADKLGDYAHTGMTPSQVAKPQTTRMMKVECPSCGCICRMTAKWLDEVGEPTCGCGTQMVFVPRVTK